MTFVMVDTLAGSHLASVSKSGSGWASANSTYTVVAAPATKLAFVTLSRYLVAGTTLQYEPNYQVGNPTTTIISVMSLDPYLNVSPVSSNTTVNFYVNSTGARGWTSPNNLALFRNISGPAFSANVLPVTLLTGQSQVNMYYFHPIQATHTITTSHPAHLLTPAT